ncbi:hypothetical protein EOL94_02580 [bacterium]|nr:hypothetical protein [bacterium]
MKIFLLILIAFSVFLNLLSNALTVRATRKEKEFVYYPVITIFSIFIIIVTMIILMIKVGEISFLLPGMLFSAILFGYLNQLFEAKGQYILMSIAIYFWAFLSIFQYSLLYPM